MTEYICNFYLYTFDLFGKGRHLYTFKNFCVEDKEIALDDGAYTIFLNTEGILNDVSPELKNFLNFVGKGKMAEEDTFVKILGEKLTKAKHNAIWRDEYMLLLTREDEKFAEGREEGRKEGVNQANERVATNMLRNSEPLTKIKMYTNLAENVILGLAEKLGISVVLS